MNTIRRIVMTAVLPLISAVTLFSDGLKTREPVRSSVKLKSKTFRITMADQGGFVAIKETR